MLSRQQPVAALVLDHSECAAVLQRHRIDFCCQGSRTLEAAATERGLDVDALLGELEAAVANRKASDDADPRQLPTKELLAALVTKHHAPLRESLPLVRGLAAKVNRVHGSRDSRLLAVRGNLEALAETLLEHFEEEERAVFPALAAEPPNPAGARALLHDLTEDHQELATFLRRIREATEDFSLPSWACTSYRTLFAELRRLEANIAAILHLEHNVLRPRFEAQP